MTVTVLGPRGNARPPYGSFAGKVPFVPSDSKNFVRNFTVLGQGGYPRSLFGSFAGKIPQINITPVVGTTFGGAGVRYPRKKHLKKILDEVLAEEAAERRQILQALQVERDEKAKAKREAAEARAAKVRATDNRERLDSIAVAADGVRQFALAEAKREAEFQAELLALLEDEEDVLMLLA